MNSGKKTISFATLGCRYNRFESAEMAYELNRAGYTHAPEGEAADVVVVNTCAVTGRGAAKARAAIRGVKARHPRARVVVTGCYAELSPDEVAAVEGVDLVVGNAEKFDLADALRRMESGAAVMVGVRERPPKLPVRPVTALEGRTNAYLNIQSGCGEVCSFCVVRHARGKSRSADAGELVAQVRRLCEAGVHEVVLSGINVGQYRDGDTALARLIGRMLDETDIARIRLSSVNPNDVTDELIGLMAHAAPRFCRHLHIPLQSGSDAILGRMRRPYTAARYEAKLNEIAARIPDIGLGADVMTGFPGEGEAEFEQTRALIERSPVMMLHVFPYSRRPGTEAAAFKDAPVKEESRRRAAMLKALGAAKRTAFIERHAGRVMDVLVETTPDEATGLLKGFTDTYIPVVFEGGGEYKGRLARVILDGAGGGRLADAP